MQRMTKAALATGAAAVLLLGGAGTMAYWTGQATATAPAALQSGSFQATGQACGAWTYTSDDGGGTVTAIVPGDTVTTTCNFTLQATGDHVALGGATVTNPVWTNPGDPLPTALGTASVGSITVTSSGSAGATATPDASTGLISPAIAVPSGATISVTINVAFPYGDATTTSLNNTQAVQAALGNIVVQLIQGHLTPTS